MNVLVTGASGFLGSAVVRAAAAQGKDVVALIRPAANLDRLCWPKNVRIARGDLRQPGSWTDELEDIEAVVHLAAAVRGDLPTQFASTVVTTENLLQHLPMQRLRRFVHVSSFSVYDYAAVGFHGTLSEKTPIDPKPDKRDAYAITKIAQEQLVVRACEKAGTHLVVIRPGAIVGPGNDWDFGRVMKVGRFDLIFSPWSKFPLTYVDNCADAIVKALHAPVPPGSIFNIVDDDLPSYGRYHRLGRIARAPGVGPGVYVPWFAVSFVGGAVALLNRVAFGGRARLPEFLDRTRQRVRWQPISYSNRAAKRDLGWSPAVSIETVIQNIVSCGYSRTVSVPVGECRPAIAQRTEAS